MLPFNLVDTNIESPEVHFENKLDKNNRWIVLSHRIPWKKLSRLYKKAIPVLPELSDQNIKIVTGASIVKYHEGLSVEKTIDFISENPYVQYLLGFKAFRPEPVNRTILSSLLNKIDSLLERHNTSIKRRKTEVSQNATYNLPDKLIFHNLNGFVFIDPENIIYIKAEGNYSTFFLENNQKEMVTENLGRIYTRLNKSIFIRTKRSYIINSKYLSRIDISKKICILSKNGAEFHCSISKEQIINFSKNLKTRQVYTHSHLNITSNPTSLPEKEYDSSFS